jgi:hypothetical protein
MIKNIKAIGNKRTIGLKNCAKNIKKVRLILIIHFITGLSSM